MAVNVIALVGALLLSWLLALIDLRLGSGIGSAAAVALVTTLHSRTAWWRVAAAAAIAGLLAAYLVHLGQQIIGPAWPGALPYAKSAAIAPALTAIAAALAFYDRARFGTRL
jgi:hypothetical protein